MLSYLYALNSIELETVKKLKHFDTHEPMKWWFQNSKLKLDVTDERVIQYRYLDANKVCQALCKLCVNSRFPLGRKSENCRSRRHLNPKERTKY